MCIRDRDYLPIFEKLDPDEEILLKFMGKVFRSCFYSFVLLQIFAGTSFADDFLLRINSILDSHCIKCHGEGGKVKGKVNLKELQSTGLLSSKPELLESLIGVI